MSLATYTSTTFLWTPYHFIAPLPLSEGHNQQPTEPSLYIILPHQLFSP